MSTEHDVRQDAMTLAGLIAEELHDRDTMHIACVCGYFLSGLIASSGMPFEMQKGFADSFRATMLKSLQQFEEMKQSGQLKP